MLTVHFYRQPQTQANSLSLSISFSFHLFLLAHLICMHQFQHCASFNCILKQMDQAHKLDERKIPNNFKHLNILSLELNSTPFREMKCLFFSPVVSVFDWNDINIVVVVAFWVLLFVSTDLIRLHALNRWRHLFKQRVLLNTIKFQVALPIYITRNSNGKITINGIDWAVVRFGRTQNQSH